MDGGRRPHQRLSEIAGKPTFRIIEGVSIRFVESAGSSEALLLSPWPESLFAYEPTSPRLAEPTHLVAIDLPGDRLVAGHPAMCGRDMLSQRNLRGDLIIGGA